MNLLTGILGLPVLAGLLIFQSAVLNQIPLLHGTADLVLLALIAWASNKQVQTAWHWGIIGALLVGYVSAVPLAVYIVGYLAAIGFALFLRRQMWNVPVLAMLLSVFAGTIFIHGLTLLTLRIVQTPISLGTSLSMIVLPSLMLNLILAMPFFFVLGDLANALYPKPLEG